jgi:hypothetical protein
MTGAWLEVFKSGTHTSGNGVTKTYTDADLDHIAKTYNDQKDHEAPLVIGHPSTDAPAHGWAKELKVAGSKLLAYVDQIADGVVDSVKRGEYKKISIAIYPDGLLRHIGLLGAMPPAVKGLAPVQFAEGMEFDEYVWATDEYRVPVVGRILSGIRDLFIEKFGLDITEKIISKFDIESLREPAATKMLTIKESNTVSEDVVIQPIGVYAEKQKLQEEEEIMETLRKQVTDLENKLVTQATEFSEKITNMQTAFQTSIENLTGLMTGKIKKDEDTARENAFSAAKAAFASFCEDLTKAGKMLPAEKDGIIEEYAEFLQSEQTMTFAEGTTRPSEKMKARLEARPAIFVPGKTVFADGKKVATKTEGAPVEFGELDVNPASIEIDKEIRTYAEAHKCSYEEAAAAYASA